MPGQTHQESKNETEMGYFPLCIKTFLTVGLASPTCPPPTKAPRRSFPQAEARIGAGRGGVLERVLSSVWLRQSQEPEFR